MQWTAGNEPLQPLLRHLSSLGKVIKEFQNRRHHVAAARILPTHQTTRLAARVLLLRPQTSHCCNRTLRFQGCRQKSSRPRVMPPSQPKTTTRQIASRRASPFS
eukprot:24243_6